MFGRSTARGSSSARDEQRDTENGGHAGTEGPPTESARRRERSDQQRTAAARDREQ